MTMPKNADIISVTARYMNQHTKLHEPYTDDERRDIASMVPVQYRARLMTVLSHYKILYSMEDDMYAWRRRTLADKLRDAADALDDSAPQYE